MNIDIIKESVKKNIGRKVTIIESGTRNRKQFFDGTIYRLYPNIFSILTKDGEKTFSYSDIATKTIAFKYQ
jgi:uncharacterized protein Veg